MKVPLLCHTFCSLCPFPPFGSDHIGVHAQTVLYRRHIYHTDLASAPITSFLSSSAATHSQISSCRGHLVRSHILTPSSTIILQKKQPQESATQPRVIDLSVVSDSPDGSH